MTILVTGAAGFIGSHVTERLLADGNVVVGIDSFDTFYDPSVKRSNIAAALGQKRFTLVEGDIRDAGQLERCFSSGPIDAVIHLAARAGVRPSLKNPELYYDVNVSGTLRLLETMRRHGTRRLLFASSSSVYGNNTKVPFSETDNVDNPVSPYAASKKAGELLCYTYHHLYGFDTFCLRYFTVYGPRQRPEMAIHQFVRKISAGEPVTLYGDGTTRRDYTFITDILDGVLKSLRCLRGYEVLNLGESRTTTLKDLVGIIEKEVGKKAVIDWQPMQPGDVMQTYADIDKARGLVGYDPCVGMEEGIAKFVAWFRRAGRA
jgi:UDP-glucuronate 4-epimerase